MLQIKALKNAANNLFRQAFLEAGAPQMVFAGAKFYFRPIFTNHNGPAEAGFGDPSGGRATNFGSGCNTPDQASPNPVLRTGGSRSIQLGLKLIW